MQPLSYEMTNRDGIINVSADNDLVIFTLTMDDESPTQQVVIPKYKFDMLVSKYISRAAK